MGFNIYTSWVFSFAHIDSINTSLFTVMKMDQIKFTETPACWRVDFAILLYYSRFNRYLLYALLTRDLLLQNNLRLSISLKGTVMVAYKLAFWGL